MANEYTVDTPELNFSQLMAEGRQRLNKLQDAATEVRAQVHKEDLDRQIQDAAVQSPFGQYIAGEMSRPVQATEYKPNFGDLAPRVTNDYGQFVQAAPVPAQVQRAAQMLQAGPPSTLGQVADNRHAAMASAISGQPTGVMMGDVVQAQLPPTVATKMPVPQPPPLPRNAAEMALLHQLGPYLAQERVAQQQYQTGMGKAVLQGEYRNVVKSAALAEDMWKTQMMTAARAFQALHHAQSTGQPFDWKVANAGLMASTRALQSAEMQVQQLQMAGYGNFPPGTPERQLFDDALSRLEPARQMQDQWQGAYSGTANRYLPVQSPPPRGLPKISAPSTTSATNPPIPGAIPTP